jgi:hypothetical protein
MEQRNPQPKSFLWHLDFEPFTWHIFYGGQCPPFVTDENKEAWQRYLKKSSRSIVSILLHLHPESRKPKLVNGC